MIKTLKLIDPLTAQEIHPHVHPSDLKEGDDSYDGITDYAIQVNRYLEIQEKLKLYSVKGIRFIKDGKEKILPVDFNVLEISEFYRCEVDEETSTCIIL